MTEREVLIFTLCMAVREVPPAIFRDMGKRRLQVMISPRRCRPRRSSRTSSWRAWS